MKMFYFYFSIINNKIVKNIQKFENYKLNKKDDILYRSSITLPIRN